MRSILIIGSVLLAILGFQACGDDDSGQQQPGTTPTSAPTSQPTATPTPTPVAQFSGTYRGVVRVTSISPGSTAIDAVDFDGELRLTQIDGTVTGDYTIVNSERDLFDSGTVAGTVSGAKVNLTITRGADGSPCPGFTSTGTLELIGDRLAGVLTGKCNEDTVTSNITMDRQ